MDSYIYRNINQNQNKTSNYNKFILSGPNMFHTRIGRKMLYDQTSSTISFNKFSNIMQDYFPDIQFNKNLLCISLYREYNYGKWFIHIGKASLDTMYKSCKNLNVFQDETYHYFPLIFINFNTSVNINTNSKINTKNIFNDFINSMDTGIKHKLKCNNKINYNKNILHAEPNIIEQLYNIVINGFKETDYYLTPFLDEFFSGI